MDTPQTAAAAIAAVIRAELGKADIKLSDAARRTGIPYATLHRRLLGTPPGFTIAELSSLASLLGTDVSALVGQSETAA